MSVATSKTDKVAPLAAGAAEVGQRVREGKVLIDHLKRWACRTGAVAECAAKRHGGKFSDEPPEFRLGQRARCKATNTRPASIFRNSNPQMKAQEQSCEPQHAPPFDVAATKRNQRGGRANCVFDRSLLPDWDVCLRHCLFGTGLLAQPNIQNFEQHFSVRGSTMGGIARSKQAASFFRVAKKTAAVGLPLVLPPRSISTHRRRTRRASVT